MDDVAVLVDKPLFQRVAIDLAAQHPLELLNVCRKVVGVRDLVPGCAEQLIARVAEDSTGFVVDGDPPLRTRGDRRAHHWQSEEASPAALAVIKFRRTLRQQPLKLHAVLLPLCVGGLRHVRSICGDLCRSVIRVISLVAHD